MVLRGGAHVRGGGEVDTDVEGGERLCQDGSFAEPGGRAAWGDEGRRGGHREGVGTPGDAGVGAEEVEGGLVCYLGSRGPPCWRGRWRKAECAQGGRRKAWQYALLMAV